MLVAVFTSCEDAYDITQPGELNPGVTFETVNDLQLGLNGVYGAIPYENIIGFTSEFTDELGIGFANGGQGLIQGEYGYVLTANSDAPYSIWQSHYTLINFANRLIAGAEFVTVEPGSDEETEKNDILAQAHILRAWGHFQLLSFFSEDITDDSALGVIAIDFVPEINQQLPRNTNAEVFALIDADLAYAVTNLQPNSNRKYLSQDFIKAFKARMAAYRGDYATALTNAQELLNAYPLSAAPVYRQIWQDLADGEVIFKLERTVDNSEVAGLYFSVNPTISGSPFYEIGRSLFNLLSPNDVRYSVIVQATSIIDPDYLTSTDYRNTDRLIIGKYPGSEGLLLVNDIKVFRASEMLLIKAEAQADAGDLTGVATTLKQLRDIRYTSNDPALADYGGNATAAWADILKERRIELAYEGHRYLDLKRLGQKANQTIDRHPLDCAVNNSCVFSNTDYRLMAFPIPRAELSANQAIRGQQNPGYSN